MVMTDIEQPTAIRRTVAFSQAIVLGEAKVEDIAARRANHTVQRANHGHSVHFGGNIPHFHLFPPAVPPARRRGISRPPGSPFMFPILLWKKSSKPVGISSSFPFPSTNVRSTVFPRLWEEKPLGMWREGGGRNPGSAAGGHSGPPGPESVGGL